MAERVCYLYRGRNQNDILIQKNTCRDFSKKKGWTIVGEEQEITTINHRGGVAAHEKEHCIRKLAEQGEFDILLVFMFDRLGNSPYEIPFILEWFTKKGIRVWSACEGENKPNIRSGRRSSPERLPRRRPIASATKRRCAGRRASTPFSLPPTQTASISITIFTTILLRWIVPGSSGISSARPALCGGSRIGCVWKMTCP